MGIKRLVISLFASATIGCGTLHIPAIPNEVNGSSVRIQEDRFIRQAQTRYEGGGYTISYCESWLRGMPEEAQMFVFLHEYAHIQLDHMGRPVYNWDRAETDADCLAGQMLRDDFGYGRKRLMVVHNFIRDELRNPPRREDAFRVCMGL